MAKNIDDVTEEIRKLSDVEKLGLRRPMQFEVAGRESSLIAQQFHHPIDHVRWL